MQTVRWVLALAITIWAGTASAQVYYHAPGGYGAPASPPVRYYTPDGYPYRADGYSYCTGNGPCGPRGLEWLVPQGFAGADFRPACSTHDRCYTIPGVSRRYCDRQFHRGLLNSCRNSRHPILCRLTAHTMFGITRLFGGPAFRASQRGWYR